MKLACVSLPGRGATDAFLEKLAARLEAQGLRLAGTVQSNIERPGRKRCDMDLRVLPDGPSLRISEDRGDLARGCMLDSGVLEQAVVEVMNRLAGAEVLIVNKFGKRECEGRGLVPAIVEAASLGIPALLGVNGLNMADLRTFAGNELLVLPPDLDKVMHWCLNQILADVG